jgi:hypothetical protein
LTFKPAVNTTSFTYERCTRPGQSLEFSVGAVGLGFADWDEKASGVLIRGGYKFMRNPDFYMRDMRYAHILKGRYLKTEFDFASYQVETDAMHSISKINRKIHLTKWAILIVFGNQWVFNDIFLIDLYSGIGLGSNNQVSLTTATRMDLQRWEVMSRCLFRLASGSVFCSNNKTNRYRFAIEQQSGTFSFQLT